MNTDYLVNALAILAVIIGIAHWLLFAILKLIEKVLDKKGNKVLETMFIYSCVSLFIISMVYCFYLLMYFTVHLVGLS